MERIVLSLLIGVLVLLGASFLFEGKAEDNTAYIARQQPVGISPFENFATRSEPYLPRNFRVRIQHKETLYQLFQRLQLDEVEVTSLVTGVNSKNRKILNTIPRGTMIHITLNDQDALKQLVVMHDSIRGTSYYKTVQGYTSAPYQAKYHKEHHYLTGSISRSLYADGTKRGMTSKMVIDFANIFAYDIDFANDVRKDDQFSVLYEELLVENRSVQTGTIRLAEFINRGKKITAIRYTTKNGNTAYFTPDGSSMRTRFLRMPVDFSRVSSRFNMRRRHPILNIVRPHTGVDFAAKPGTPVRAVGNGRIIHAAGKGGYGSTVIIDHGDKYTTLYAHLQGFSRNARKGNRIKQGDIIGYVGSTGLSTGPHLHYEFRVRGEHKDPLKVKIPRRAKLSQGELGDFKKHVRQVMANRERAKLQEISSTKYDG